MAGHVTTLWVGRTLSVSLQCRIKLESQDYGDVSARNTKAPPTAALLGASVNVNVIVKVRERLVFISYGSQRLD